MISSNELKTNNNESEKNVKKKIKQRVPKEKKALTTSIESNSSTKKNVSWAETYFKNNEKKSVRCTPYPNPAKKIKISAESTPKALCFDDSDSDGENFATNVSKSQKTKGVKRKRTSSKKPKSGWTITSNKLKVKPDKSNLLWKEKNLLLERDSSPEQVVKSIKTRSNKIYYFENNKISDSNHKLAATIKQKLRNVQDESQSSDDDFENTSNHMLTAPTILFESSTSEDDSSTEDIFRPVILNKNFCEIIEPNIFNKTPKTNGQKKENLSAKKSPNIENKSQPKITGNKKNKGKNSPNIENKSNSQPKVKVSKKNKDKKLPNIESEIISPAVVMDNKEIKVTNSPNIENQFNLPPIVAFNKKNKNKNEVKSNKQDLEHHNESDSPKKINILDKIKYFIGETHCIIILKHPVKLHLHGNLLVSVLSGSVEILGHILKYNNKTEPEIYCPRGQCFLCFETVEWKRNPNLTNELVKYSMSEEQVESFCVDLEENDCIITVRSIKNEMVNYLEKHVAQLLYPNPGVFDKRPLNALEGRLRCLFEMETNSWKLYKKHEEWASLVETALFNLKENNSRTVLCGGKSVGKSVLLRYIINNMLNEVEEVVCIDLDPGQSEFTIGGCISVSIIDSPIFGPNYTHLKTPKKSFFIGDVNVSNILNRYVSCIEQIINYCEQNISKEIPWVINYMGYSKSIGTDLINLILKLIAPSLVIQIESDKKSRNYQSKLTPDYIMNYKTTFPLKTCNNKINYTLKLIKSVAEEKISGEWESEPRLLREMCILSYFSQMLGDKNEITAITPYSVKIPSIKLYNMNYEKENILATLNGLMVALCSVNTNEEINHQTTFSCFGFGIVRGIDKETEELYLLTPVPEDELENVNCLVRGNIALPPSLYMTSGHQSLVPYILLGIPQGTTSIPKRSFKNWRALLKKNK